MSLALLSVASAPHQYRRWNPPTKRAISGALVTSDTREIHETPQNVFPALYPGRLRRRCCRSGSIPRQRVALIFPLGCCRRADNAA